MANVVDGQIEWLKDESTGVPVGFKKRDGTEGGLVTTSVNPLTGGMEIRGPDNSLLAAYVEPPQAPPAVQNVVATAGNASAKLQFFDGHLSADFYTITVTPGGAELTYEPTGHHCAVVVPNLTNGVSYSFSVSAASKYGVGPAAVSNTITPTDLPAITLPVSDDLEFWWSAALVTGAPANGGAYTQMVDMSGNNHHAAGVGTGNGGTWVSDWSNGHPAVAFNGTNQYYHTLNSGLWQGLRSTEASIYVLYKCTGNPNPLGVTGGRVISYEKPDPGSFGTGFAAGVGSTSGQAGGELYTQSYQYSAATITAPNIAVPTTPIIMSVSRPGICRVNGVSVAGTTGFASNKTEENCPLSIGAMHSGGFNKYMQGQIAEVLVFAKKHTVAEMALIENYLAARC